MAAVGGQIQGISIDSFLQMVQMEKTTCTLKVFSEEDVGFIYILKGVLIAAEVGALSGPDAAYEIISWSNSIIEIENVCERSEDEIKQPLMTILMEGLRLRDERQSTGGQAKLMDTQSRKAPPRPSEPQAPQPPASDAPTNQTEDAVAEVKSASVRETPEFTFPKAPKRKASLSKIVLILIAAIAAGAAAYHFMGLSGGKKQYQTLQSQLRQATSPMEKVDLLEAYLETGPTGEHAAEAADQLASLKRAMDEDHLAAAAKTAATLKNRGDLDGAYAVLSKYLAENPKSTARRHAETEMATLKTLMADTDFEALTRDTANMGPERLNRYDDFLKAYPDSAHEKAVRERIAGMEKEYVDYFETQLAIATHEENWLRGETLVRRFVRLYPDHPRTPIFKKLTPVFEKNQVQKADFERLMADAQAKGSDYTAAGAVLTQYLSAYPDTYLRDRITAQIARYQRLSEEARIAALINKTAETVNAAGKRFKARTDGTVLDTRTHLMWTLLDSEASLKDCIDFSGAKTFVAGLKTGGHDDWRLPSPEELEALYKETPALPTADTHAWYWSAKFYRLFVGEWVSKVTVVGADSLPSRPPLQKDSRDCGSVRAVRRP